MARAIDGLKDWLYEEHPIVVECGTPAFILGPADETGWILVSHQLLLVLTKESEELFQQALTSTSRAQSIHGYALHVDKVGFMPRGVGAMRKHKSGQWVMLVGEEYEGVRKRLGEEE